MQSISLNDSNFGRNLVQTELAFGNGRERIYLVDQLEKFENDPDS